jgi:anti-sigma B factor antagonist
MSFRVDTTTERDHSRIRAVGEVDLATVNALRTAITDAIAAGVRHVTLDLEGVSYLDSSGLGTLVGAHKRLTALGGTLVVECTRPRILRLLAITGVDSVLTVVAPASESEAARA